MANIIKALVRWIFWSLTAVMGTVLLLYAFLQTDYAKTYVTKSILGLVSERTNYELRVEGVDIDWFDMISVNAPAIIDSQDSLMFSAKKATVNYSVYALIRNARIEVDGLALSDAQLNLYKHNNSASINLVTFLKELGGGDKKKEPREIIVNQISAKNWNVSYKDLRQDSTVFEKNIFNPVWFSFHIDQLLTEELTLHDDTLELDIVTMSGQELYSGFPVTAFTSKFGLYPSAMIFHQLSLKTRQSKISDSLVLSYNRPANLSNIKDSVEFYWRSRSSILDLTDLTYFGKIPKVSEKLSLDGRLKGRLSNLDLENFTIQSTEKSYVQLDASLIGLPSLSETFMDFRVKASEIKSGRIEDLIQTEQISLGDVKFSGSLVGFINDFVAYGNIVTKSGKVSTDINLKLNESINQSAYTGNLRLSQFDIGDIISTDLIKTLDFQGSIAGVGFTKETANFKLDASAQNILLNDYSYDSISVAGDFKANFFDGAFDVKDDRGKIKGIATIDFSQSTEVISLDVTLDSISLLPFGLSRRPTWLSAHLNADLNEIAINQMTGTVSVIDLLVENEQEALDLDAIKFQIVHDSLKSYALTSDLVDIDIRGDFNITELIQEFPMTVKAYMSYFTLGDTSIVQFDDQISYRTQIDVELKTLNPLFELLNIPVAISNSSILEVNYNHINDISFGVYGYADTIKFRDRVFYQNELLVDASKDPSSSRVLALLQLNSEQQQWNEKISTQNLLVEAIWSQDQIASTMQIAQLANGNQANIQSVTQLKKDTIDFKILPSELTVFDTQWNINKENQIRLLDNKFIINDLQIYNGPQLVSFDGVISDSLLTELNFEFSAFDLLNLSTLSPRKIAGVVDARGRVSRLNNQRPLRFETDVAAKGLAFEDILIGDLNGNSEWDRAEDGLYIDYQITRQNIKTIDLNGYFKPFQEDQLDLQVSFDQANLQLIEPLFETLVSGVSGTATGELSLTGQLARPKLRGVSTINDGSVRIDYLNTLYNFSGVTRFFEEQIAFDNISVKDRFNHQAYLNGAINHKQFEDIFLNIYLNYDQFELLNTNNLQNSLYYGNAYATGTLEMKGPAQNILISASATSTSNTRIFIPLNDEKTAEQGAFITFKTKDSQPTETDESLDLTGVNIDFDMDLTPDAYIELIFNPRTGDIIRGRGNGNLQLTVNSSGDFDLFGNYTVSEGAYNFTTAVFNKEFQVLPGGTINWFGNPYEGVMDISASYRQLADVNDWNPTIDNESQNSQKRPVLVMLDIDGPMMAPDITFELQLEEQTNTADLTTDWNRSISTINANEEELKRQVFSLLVLRRFSERTSFIVGGSSLSDGFSNSVGEFVSNQLSYWLNQVDENLEIDFDINSLSAEAFNNFQLRLAYSFLDGRLRVTRGGGFTTIVDESVNTDLQNILGDWSVEYLLTEDGKWRLRFFSRNNQYNATTQSTSFQQGQETGLSFQYVTSFDEFREIIQSGRNKKPNEEGTEESSD